MRSPGDFDSEGHFTIAEGKSVWKLAKYRLARAGTFPLFALASAVESGARHFRLRVGQGQTHLEFDGTPFSREELLELRSPYGSDKSKRMSNLQIALSAASGLGTVRFSSVQDGVRHVLTMVGTEAVYSPEQRDPRVERTSLILDKALNLADIAHFDERSRFAPLASALEVPGYASKKTAEGQQVLAWAAGRNQDHFDFPLSTVPHNKKLQLDSELTGNPSYFVVFRTHQEEDPGSVLLMQSGVIVDELYLGRDFALMNGIASVPHLKMDLSSSGLLRNQKFDNFKAELKSLGNELLRVYLQAQPTLTADARRLLIKFLKARYVGQKLPDEVQEYFAKVDQQKDLENVQATRSFSALAKIAAEAKETQDWSIYTTMMVRLRSKLQDQWEKESWTLARGWADALRFLAIEGDDDGVGFRSCRESFSFLSGANIELEWVQSVFDSEEVSQEAKFRALCVLAPTLEPKKLASLAKNLKVPFRWTLPLRFFGDKDLSVASSNHALLWEAARRLCSGGPYEDIVGLVKTGLDKLDCSKEAHEVWMQVLFFATKGKLSWPQQVRLRSELARCWLDLDISARNRFRGFIGRRRTPDPPTQGLAWFQSDLDDRELFFPILVHQMYLLSEDAHVVRAEVLGRRLLQESFRGTRWAGNFEERLPTSLFGL